MSLPLYSKELRLRFDQELFRDPEPIFDEWVEFPTFLKQSAKGKFRHRLGRKPRWQSSSLSSTTKQCCRSRIRSYRFMPRPSREIPLWQSQNNVSVLKSNTGQLMASLPSLLVRSSFQHFCRNEVSKTADHHFSALPLEHRRDPLYSFDCFIA